jgi:hypothetical protein
LAGYCVRSSCGGFPRACGYLANPRGSIQVGDAQFHFSLKQQAFRHDYRYFVYAAIPQCVELVAASFDQQLVFKRA